MDLLVGLVISCACILLVPAFFWVVLSELGQKRRQALQAIQAEQTAKVDAQLTAHYRAVDLSGIDTMSGYDFEKYVARLLVNEGFVNVEVT